MRTNARRSSLGQGSHQDREESAHASSVEELPSATKEDKAKKALTQVRKKELEKLRRVRVHSRDELRLEDGDK